MAEERPEELTLILTNSTMQLMTCCYANPSTNLVKAPTSTRRGRDVRMVNISSQQVEMGFSGYPRPVNAVD